MSDRSSTLPNYPGTVHHSPVSSLPHQQDDGECFLEPKPKVPVLTVTKKSLPQGRRSMKRAGGGNLIN